MAKFDWDQGGTGYGEDDDSAKRAFHREARKRLARLAGEMGLAKGDYDLRTNMAGPASRGETTLHAEGIYVQAGGLSNNLLVRTCRGRRDYTGGPNNFAPIDALDDVPRLAARVQGVMAMAQPA